jgi:hypothetical protein
MSILLLARQHLAEIRGRSTGTSLRNVPWDALPESAPSGQMGRLGQEGRLGRMGRTGRRNAPAPSVGSRLGSGMGCLRGEVGRKVGVCGPPFRNGEGVTYAL